MKTIVSQDMKRFNHLISEIISVYHTASLKLELSDSVMQILYTICDFGESCLLADIIRLTGLTKQTVNSAIRNLEHGGIICLEPVNSKSKKVILTKQGVLLVEKTVVRLMKAENEIFSSWNEYEIIQYLALTERYLSGLKEKTESL